MIQRAIPKKLESPCPLILRLTLSNTPSGMFHVLADVRKEQGNLMLPPRQWIEAAMVCQPRPRDLAVSIWAATTKVLEGYFAGLGAVFVLGQQNDALLMASPGWDSLLNQPVRFGWVKKRASSLDCSLLVRDNGDSFLFTTQKGDYKKVVELTIFSNDTKAHALAARLIRHEFMAFAGTRLLQLCAPRIDQA